MFQSVIFQLGLIRKEHLYIFAVSPSHYPHLFTFCLTIPPSPVRVDTELEDKIQSYKNYGKIKTF